MGHRSDKQTKAAKLNVRKETVRSLRTLTEDDMRGAVGGMWQPPPPRPSVQTVNC